MRTSLRSVLVPFVLITSAAMGQFTTTSLEVGRFRALLSSDGRFIQTPSAGPSMTFLENGVRPPLLYCGALWLAGSSSDEQALVSAVDYGALSDMQPGPLDNAGMIAQAMVEQYDRSWLLTRTEVERHQAWFACSQDPGCDMEPLFPGGYTMPEVIASWPAHGDVSIGQAYDLAPFLDADQNGVYDPLAGDVPCIPGDVAVFNIFNDLRQARTGGSPLHTEVHMTTFGYEPTDPDDVLGRTLFTKYRIINRSDRTYEDLYVGTFNDIDLACWYDDYAGSDVGRSLVYMMDGGADACDTQLASTFDGLTPAFGLTVLQGPRLDADGEDNAFQPALPAFNGTGFGDGVPDNERFGWVFNMAPSNTGGSDPPATTDPHTEVHFSTYMRGLWKDGSPLTYGGSGYGGTIPTDQCYPGNSDPNGVAVGGQPQAPWSEASAGNIPYDRRLISSMGPFTMEAGQEEEVVLAYVLGPASADTAASSVVGLQANVDALKALVADLPGVLQGSSTCAVYPVGIQRPAVADASLLLHPNPAQDLVRISLPNGVQQADWRLFDARGAQVLAGSARSGPAVLDVVALPAGLYLVQLQAAGHTYLGRLMKR